MFSHDHSHLFSNIFSGVHLIVSVMKHLAFESAVQESGLNALKPFVSSAQYRKRCDEEGVVNRALHILTAHPSDVPLIKGALG